MLRKYWSQDSELWLVIFWASRLLFWVVCCFWSISRADFVKSRPLANVCSGDKWAVYNYMMTCFSSKDILEGFRKNSKFRASPQTQTHTIIPICSCICLRQKTQEVGPPWLLKGLADSQGLIQAWEWWFSSKWFETHFGILVPEKHQILVPFWMSYPTGSHPAGWQHSEHFLLDGAMRKPQRRRRGGVLWVPWLVNRFHFLKGP